MEGDTTKGPDTGKDKVELIQLLGTVGRGVFWGQQALKKVTQHLDMAVVSHWGDLLEAGAHGLQAQGNVFIKEDGQISSL